MMQKFDQGLSTSLRSRMENGQALGNGTWLDEVAAFEDVLFALVEDVTCKSTNEGNIRPPFQWDSITRAIHLLGRYGIEVDDERGQEEPRSSRWVE